MNKTAMQQMIDFINGMKITQTLLNGCDIETVHIPSLIHRAEELLVTEKQQHIETFNAGTKARYIRAAKHLGLETLPEGVETGEQYYNQTFGQ